MDNGQQQQLQQQQSAEPSQTETFNLAIQQPTTVIIRKDMLSFNFSDIEVSERPSSLHRNSEHQRLSQRAVTGTPKPPTTELNDIFISVKTTKNYHDSRLALIIKTWFQLAKEQVRRHLLLFLLSFSFEIYGNCLVRILSRLWILPFMAFEISFGFTFWRVFGGTPWNWFYYYMVGSKAFLWVWEGNGRLLTRY